jgi:hypothetical protein
MLLGMCCKCQGGDAGYSGQSGSGGGSGGGGPSGGTPGGCDICPTVPQTLSVTLTMNFTCPCSYSGTYSLQHRAGVVFGTDRFANLPLPNGVCDSWLSDTKLKNSSTCVLGTTPRIEIQLYSYLGLYYWTCTVWYGGGFSNPYAQFSSGEDGTNCFTRRSSTAFSYSAFFPCTITSASFEPA